MANVALTPSQALSQAFSVAVFAYNARKFVEAEQICQHIIAAKSDHFDALNLLAAAQSNLGKKDMALASYDRALVVRPDCVEALSDRGNTLHEVMRFPEALASYDRALAVRPDCVEVLSNRGATLHELKRFAEALASYDRALAVRPDYAEVLSNRGATLHELKRFAEALASYDGALAIRPDDAKALSNRGNTLKELKRFPEALASYDRALAVRPDDAETLYSRGITLHQLKRFPEALASYDRALAVRPNNAEALYSRGISLHQLKRFPEALASYDRALTVRPDYVEALYTRGVTLKELKRFDEAMASYDRALAVRPDYVEAFYSRGNTLHELKQFPEALASYDRALAVRPDYVEALTNRGATLQELKQFEEALASYDRALAASPDYAEALSNRGNTLHDLKRFPEALASYDRALAVRPDYAEAFYNRGNALHAQKQFPDALASYDGALALRSDYAVALSNRGNTLHDLKRFPEALASYDRALAVQPDYAEAHHNKSLCRRLIGDFDRGWEKCEWRWETEQQRTEKRNFPQPLWRGSNEIAGKTVLLHAEQGYGDTIQFCRYVPLVAERGARVILEVQRPLHELMSTLAGAAQIITTGDLLPDFEVHCPLLSLPLAFGTRLDTIPSATPYLRAPSQATTNWDARLPKRRPRIGLAWSGNPVHKNDRNRSIGLSCLSSLIDIDATFVSLQNDVRTEDATALKDRGDLLHFGDALRNFSDTAALISNLDLVISVDTGVAHLAGALAKPVWVLLPYIPDWRWLLDRDDSPWYPTGRLFRQDDTRAWDNVIARVHTALHEFVHCRS